MKDELLRFDREPLLHVLKNIEARTKDVLALNLPNDSFFADVVSVSGRGYVRIYSGVVPVPLLKYFTSIFRGADVKVDVMNREIVYKDGFGVLARQLQNSYSCLKDWSDIKNQSNLVFGLKEE